MKSFALHVGRGCVVAACILALCLAAAGQPVLGIVYAAGSGSTDTPIIDHYKVERGQLVTVGYIGGLRSEWHVTDAELRHLGLVRIAPRHVTVYIKAGHDPSARMIKDVGVGDSRVTVEWLPASRSPRDLPAYPAIHIHDANAWEYGPRDLNGLHLLLQRHQPDSNALTCPRCNCGCLWGYGQCTLPELHAIIAEPKDVAEVIQRAVSGAYA